MTTEFQNVEIQAIVTKSWHVIFFDMRFLFYFVFFGRLQSWVNEKKNATVDCENNPSLFLLFAVSRLISSDQILLLNWKHNGCVTNIFSLEKFIQSFRVKN